MHFERKIYCIGFRKFKVSVCRCKCRLNRMIYLFIVMSYNLTNKKFRLIFSMTWLNTWLITYRLTSACWSSQRVSTIKRRIRWSSARKSTIKSRTCSSWTIKIWRSSAITWVSVKFPHIIFLIISSMFLWINITSFIITKVRDKINQ